MLRKIASLPLPLRTFVCAGAVLAFAWLCYLWPPLAPLAFVIMLLSAISVAMAMAMEDFLDD